MEAEMAQNSHLMNNLQNGSAPSSGIPNGQQQGQQNTSRQQQQQPANYPSPTSYPSPSLTSAQYNYPPPQQGADYRASPTGSNSSLNLPSMRSLDPLQQQQQQQQQMNQVPRHDMGSQLPPPVAQMGGNPYYHNQGQSLPHPSSYPSVTSDPTGQMRYALPVTDNRQMSGGRHKKEIKRRTKTGCLTCRKRRIKCDEGQPACRNCQKSKRECQGYDPIFKQQPGPSPIQPAPSSGPSQGNVPATVNTYGVQPHLIQGYGTQANMAYDPALSTGNVSSPGSAPQYDYSSAIDPALEAASGAPAPTMTYSHPGMASFNTRPLEECKPPGMTSFKRSSTATSNDQLDEVFKSTCRGGGVTLECWKGVHKPSGSEDLSNVEFSDSSMFDPKAAFHSIPSEYSGPLTNFKSVAKRTMDDLLVQAGETPTALLSVDPSQTPAEVEEAKHLYYSIYAPGLENFLETKWFTVKGAHKLVSSKTLLIEFGTLLKRFAATDANNAQQMSDTASVEARVVWKLAKMVQAGAADIGNKQSGLVPSPDDPTESMQRLAVFEILLTGAVATSNALTQPVPGSTDHHRLRELEFWFTLGNFVCFPYEDSSAVKNIDDTLAALRNLLDGRENRDVLYSIAVVRALSHRVSEYNDTDTPLHFDENDNKSKLSIAKKFVGDEGEGAGTTNVIRRLCELATRSWAPPAGASPTTDKPE